MRMQPSLQAKKQCMHGTPLIPSLRSARKYFSDDIATSRIKGQLASNTSHTCCLSFRCALDHSAADFSVRHTLPFVLFNAHVELLYSIVGYVRAAELG